jgi:pimeloyl-ACP methyl ester carboxylesterase
VPSASNGAVRIHYSVDGAGPPLLLHHGFTGSSRDWETFGFVAVLRERFQVIMLDAHWWRR